ncbi:MAG: DoxX family protein [Leptospiraceae bacterium]
MKKKILTGLCILVGLLFINGGLNKFLGYIPEPTDLPEDVLQAMNAMKQIVWLMPLLAVAEIVGGALLMVPKLRALGAVILFPVLAGIVLHHITIAPSGLPIALVILAIFVWVVYEEREKFISLVS